MELFSVDHVEATKILLAARIAGQQVTAGDKAPHGDLLSIALGHQGWEHTVPVLNVHGHGHLFGTHAILRYLARSASSPALYGGGSEIARASVDQWLDFVDNQARFAASPLLYNATKTHHIDAKDLAVAKNLLKNTLSAADTALISRTFLGGDRFTIADISLSVTLHAVVHRELFDISSLPHLSRWYKTCTNQHDFVEVLKAKLPTIHVHSPSAAAGGKGGKKEHQHGGVAHHGKDEKKQHDKAADGGATGGKKEHAARGKDEHHKKGGDAAKPAAKGATGDQPKVHAAGAAAKWTPESNDTGEFSYAAGSSFVAPLIAHYAAAARSSNGGPSSDWKDSNWPASNILTTLKRASGSISLKVGSNTITGDQEIARYLAYRYRSLNLYAAAPMDSAQVDEFIEMTLSAPSNDALGRLNTHLTLRTFLADHNATIADFFVWAWLLAEPPKADAHLHVARWFAFFPQHVALVLGASVAPVAAAPTAVAAPAASTKKDDDFDLFGEEDAEHEKLLEQRRKEHEEKKKASGKVVIAKSSIILEIKPWDDTTDLNAMLKAVKSIEMEGLTWGAHKIVPVAYGINMIQIVSTVIDDLVSVEDLTDRITAFEDLVQSVDIAAFNKL